MKRSKPKIKKEEFEPTTSHAFNQEEHDLAYYIHDRVELMHQVFSVLKYKDLKSIAPACVRRLSIDDLQELCLEELLGISSKRLCAILDGAEPPSDTESSSQSEHFETISLDSISSDEEILSETSKKSKKKHRHRRNSKHKRKKSKDHKNDRDSDQTDQENDKSKASRAGLTVLELLELQARARAIRAQLQQEQINKPTKEVTTVSNNHTSDDDEVEIKEEPPEVFEISSEDEKPKIEELQIQKQKTPTQDVSGSNGKKKENEVTQENDRATKANASKPETITRRTKDLIVTVTRQPTRKIKLTRNRNKFSTPTPNVSDFSITCDNNSRAVQISGQSNVNSEIDKPKPTTDTSKSNDNSNMEKQKNRDKSKKKQKKKVKTKANDASDDDEITLQLSDSEKMDLLEDYDRKNYDRRSSSGTEDSESSSSDSEDQASNEQKKQNVSDISIKAPQSIVIEDKVESVTLIDLVETVPVKENNENNIITEDVTKKVNVEENVAKNFKKDQDVGIQNDSNVNNPIGVIEENEIPKESKNKECLSEKYNKIIEESDTIDTEQPKEIIESKVEKEKPKSPDLPDNNCMSEEIRESVLYSNVNKSDNSNLKENIDSSKVTQENDTVEQSSKIAKNPENILVIVSEEVFGGVCNVSASKDVSQDEKRDIEEVKSAEKKSLSDGELTEQDSSEVETIDLRPEVVCISDDETPKKGGKIKKNKNKDKKNKKEKKSKKNKSDVQKGDDQNFCREHGIVDVENTTDCLIKLNKKYINIDDYDDVYEILELSDDSSCYELEGFSVSKEPTAEEIATLSAKIDEIDREDVITDAQIREYESKQAENQDSTELENISWKDRYLGSKKVKTVLTTANILNAMRKKNKDLKKKLEESKKAVELVVEKEIEKEQHNLEEGTIEHYNTLEGSTKYVHPVPDPAAIVEKEKTEAGKDGECQKVDDNTQDKEENGNVLITDTQVTKEMKKDAKQLLKMYKRLLKYNDMNKQKDPNKKKKKKTKNKEGKKK